MAQGNGTKEDPWLLRTPPPQTSQYQMYYDVINNQKVIVCVVGKTTLSYDHRAVEDLHAMLVARGDWVELGNADEQKQAKDDTVEAWARSAQNPIHGWYGLKKGLEDASEPICHRYWRQKDLLSLNITPVATV